MGGLILLWLGVTFILRQNYFITDSQWGSTFFIGLGLIVALRGVMFYVQKGSWVASSGLILGGLVITSIAIMSYWGLQDWWPFLVILLGLWLVLSAIMGRRNNPRP